MLNYPPNKVVDIFLILGKCHKNYGRAARVYTQFWSPTSGWSAKLQYWNNISQESIPSPDTKK